MSTRMVPTPNPERGQPGAADSTAEPGRHPSGSQPAHISADATICFNRASTLTQRAGREANLIVIAHPNQAMLGRRYRVSADSPLEVGRSSETTLSFPDVPSISRKHARLIFNDGEVWLEDLGSRNGTFLNDEPVRGSKLLASGDRFQVGTVVFKFPMKRTPSTPKNTMISPTTRKKPAMTATVAIALFRGIPCRRWSIRAIAWPTVCPGSTRSAARAARWASARRCT